MDIGHFSSVFWAFTVLLVVTGLYGVLASFNLIRLLIGMEILIKAATLFLVFGGHLTGDTALSQALVITLIVIEVVVMVVANGLILCLHRQTGSIEKNVSNGTKG